MNKFKKYLNNQSGSILTLLILVVISAVAIFLYIGKGNIGNLANQINEILSKQGDNVSTKTITATSPTSQAQIMITSEGFIPIAITVSKGQQIAWVNKDKSTHQIVSKDLDLDSDILKQSDSFIFVFEKIGTFTYSDAKNPLKVAGTVIVR